MAKYSRYVITPAGRALLMHVIGLYTVVGSLIVSAILIIAAAAR